MNHFNSSDRYQQLCEKLLLFGALGVCLFHMLVSSYKNALPMLSFFRHADEWIGLMLFIAVLTYFGAFFFLYPHSRYRYKKLIRKFNAYEYWFSFLLVFWYALSCALHKYYAGKTAFKSNDWWLYITWLMSFFVFPFARVVGVKQAKKYVDPVLRIVLIPHIIFFAWLLWNYFRMNYVTLPSGNTLKMTFPGPGLAAGENRNNTASTALAMMGLCWYMLVTQKSYRKIPYGLGVAIYLAVLILTNSRTSWIAGLVMFALVTFRLIWGTLRTKQQWLRVMTGIIVAAICVLFLQNLRGEMFELLDRATNFTGNNSAPVQTTVWNYDNNNILYNLAQPMVKKRNISAFSVQPVELKEAADYARTTEAGLHGREEIYQACLHVMFSRKYIFLFGVTHADVPSVILGVCGVPRLYSDAHNYWLQIGVAFGFPMMLAAFVFTVFLMVRSLHILFREKDEPFSGAWTVAVLVLSTFVFELAETQISSGSQIICPAFYLFAGWVVAMDLDRKSKKDRNGEELI